MSMIRIRPRAGYSLAFALVIAAIAAAACPAMDPPAGAAADDAPVAEGVVARVGSTDITQAQLEEEFAAELAEVERQRYEVLERGMESAIDQALLALDAEDQGVATDEILERVYVDVKEPSQEAIDAFYEARKSSINRPKEQVAGQIRDYLRRQAERAAYVGYMGDLRERYEVRRYLEPYRSEVGEGGGPAKGPETAPVTIVEFSDFQCPYCQRLAPTMDRITDRYGDQVRLVFRQFPLPNHSDAQKAAEASLCAAEDGKFWEMHDAMFANIRTLGVDELKKKADALGLDAAAFGECLDSGKYEDQVAADLRDGRLVGVSGTPAMFINGRFLSGAKPYEEIAALIDDELARASREATN